MEGPENQFSPQVDTNAENTPFEISPAETSSVEKMQTEAVSTPVSTPSSIEKEVEKSAKLDVLRGKKIIVIVAIVIIALLAWNFAPLLGWEKTTTTSTTIPQVNLSRIQECRDISSPGTYYLASNINTSLTNGACIKVLSNDVMLFGNQNNITGSGPYNGLPPFSYGIELQNVSNVSVTGFKISRFSYDIFVNNTHNSSIYQNNLTSSTLSGVYLSKSQNNTIERNYIAQSQSKEGGIYLRSGDGNKVLNNTLINNAYYGLVINSTNNNFTKNDFAGNGADLVCNTTSAFKNANKFSGSICSINNYCEFAACKTNIPFNLSSLRLTPGNISTCGAIYAPGNFLLTKNLSAYSYVNASNPLAKNISCIQIIAPNVNLDCKEKKISNSGYGIYLYAAFNSSISNCSLTNNTYGIYSSGALNPQVSDTNIKNNNYGMYLKNTFSGKMSNINLLNNTYGAYFESSSGVLFSNINAQGNTYGVYTYSGDSNIFNGGKATGNVKADFYCSAETYNSTTNLMQNLDCGTSDCTWASCSQYMPPSLTSHPLSSCTTINYPGNYSLKQNLIAKGNCFKIAADNVKLNCGAHTIIGDSTGIAFEVAGRSNVTISSCNVLQFNKTVNVTNSNEITLTSIKINNTALGVSFSNVSSSTVKNVSVAQQTSLGFYFNKLNSSTITQNRASQGTISASGFVFRNSSNNLITQNNGASNPSDGFQFINSINNRIFNNSAFSNTRFDYSCAGSSAGLDAEPIGINYGLSKGSTCNWLVELDPSNPDYSCAGISSPTQVVLKRDLYYTYGNTCFSIYVSSSSSANYTVIDCNGHTVYADHGGTFVNIVNASDVTVKNCVITNMTSAITSSGPNTNILNNTIEHVVDGINVFNTRFATISKNKLADIRSSAIVANQVGLSTISDNKVSGADVGIALVRVTSSNIYNNTLKGTASGMYLINSTTTNLKDNTILNTSIGGLLCLWASVNTSSLNLDFGGNICSSSVGCMWMTTSPTCKVA